MKTPVLERPKWGAVVLVCKDCAKRSSGPKHLKAKALVSIGRKQARGPTSRSRTMTTGCLGLCPKAATAVAFAGDDMATRIVAVKSPEQLEAAIAMLRAEREPVVSALVALPLATDDL